MRGLVGWILALGLVVSPGVAKAGGAAGDDKPAAKTDQPAAPATTAPAASNAAAAKPAPANLESELDELRDLLQSQAKQIQDQSEQLKQQQQQMQTLEERLNGAGTTTSAPASTLAAAPVNAPEPTTIAAAMALPSSSPVPAASSPVPAAVAATPQDMDKPSPLYFSIGSAHFTPGGFMDLTDVFRTKNTTNGLGTNFAAIPYNNSYPNAGLTENRFSAQNSRLTMRVDAKAGGGDATGYVEADFLGNAAASLNTTSNANTLRMRVYFIDFRRGKFEFLAGQDWSMLTSSRTGIAFMPGDVFNTQDFDTNYQMGLVWERTPQVRFVLHPTKTFAVGFSLENAEQYVGTTAPTFPTGFNNAQVNVNGTNTTANVGPDVIVKAAFDPKFGMRSAHFEVSGLYRTFRINNASGSTNFGNSTISGAGVAANTNFEIFKNFKLFENFFWSDGGGRDIANSGVPDFIVHAANTATGAPSAGNLQTLSAVHSGSAIAGFEYQTTPKLLLYSYFSGVYVDRNVGATNNTVTCTLATGVGCLGYGFGGATQNVNRLLQEGTVGWVQYFWRSPNYGALSMINQLSYMDRYPWAPGATGGNTPKNAHDVAAWVDVRYTLP